MTPKTRDYGNICSIPEGQKPGLKFLASIHLVSDSEYTAVPSSAGNQRSFFADLIKDQRKHAILFAATLLSARKVVDWMESDKPTMAKQIWVDKAIREAEFILRRMDNRSPSSLKKVNIREASDDPLGESKAKTSGSVEGRSKSAFEKMRLRDRLFYAFFPHKSPNR